MNTAKGSLSKIPHPVRMMLHSEFHSYLFTCINICRREFSLVVKVLGIHQLGVIIYGDQNLMNFVYLL